jgi:hypothetical protein
MSAALVGHPSGWAYGPPSRLSHQRKVRYFGVYQF